MGDDVLRRIARECWEKWAQRVNPDSLELAEACAREGARHFSESAFSVIGATCDCAAKLTTVRGAPRARG